MRILCVADDRSVAYLIKHVLAFEGHGVTLARAWDEASSGLADDVDLIVTTGPAPRQAGASARLVALGAPVEPEAVVAAVRQAAAGR
jgi:CheY-like chemotaxis protein